MKNSKKLSKDLVAKYYKENVKDKSWNYYHIGLFKMIIEAGLELDKLVGKILKENRDSKECLACLDIYGRRIKGMKATKYRNLTTPEAILKCEGIILEDYKKIFGSIMLSIDDDSLIALVDLLKNNNPIDALKILDFVILIYSVRYSPEELDEVVTLKQQLTKKLIPF